MKKGLFIFFLTISSFCYSQKDSTKLYPHFSNSISSGIWIPTGNLSKLGVHPFFGGKIGLQLNSRMLISITTQIRFGKSRSDYEYIYNGQFEVDNYFQSFAGGIQLDFVAYKGEKIETGLLTGILYDRFQFKDINKGFYSRLFTNNIAATSPNLFIGCYIDIIKIRRISLGLYSTYNLIDYTKGNKINLTGNSLNLGIQMKISNFDPFISP